MSCYFLKLVCSFFRSHRNACSPPHVRLQAVLPKGTGQTDAYNKKGRRQSHRLAQYNWRIVRDSVTLLLLSIVWAVRESNSQQRNTLILRTITSNFTYVEKQTLRFSVSSSLDLGSLIHGVWLSFRDHTARCQNGFSRINTRCRCTIWPRPGKICVFLLFWATSAFASSHTTVLVIIDMISPPPPRLITKILVGFFGGS